MRTALSLLALTSALLLPLAVRAADSAADGSTAIAPPPADLHYLEGVWKPGGGAPPKAPPPGASGGAPPARVPETAASVAGSGLVCAPENTMRGAGGGMSNLWIQGPHEIVMLNEENQDYRQIFLRAAHPKHIVPQINGNSIGHWEGNTLVVDTIGYADKDGKAIDQHIVEHIERAGDTMQDHAEITLNGVTTSQNFTQTWRPDLQVWENICEEGFAKFKIVGGKVDDVNQ